MYLYTVLHDGSPEFMVAVLTLLVALVMSQTVVGSGIARHPYAKPADGGELASDLPADSIGRPEFEPLLFSARHSRRPHRRLLESRSSRK
jgi:hypothetical protein